MCERYVGTESGGMDQAISMMGMPQIAKLIEFNPVSPSHVLALLMCHDITLDSARSSSYTLPSRQHSPIQRGVESMPCNKLMLELAILMEGWPTGPHWVADCLTPHHVVLCRSKFPTCNGQQLMHVCQWKASRCHGMSQCTYQS